MKRWSMKYLKVGVAVLLCITVGMFHSVHAENQGTKINLTQTNLIDENISAPLRPSTYLIDDQDKVPVYPEMIENGVFQSMKDDTWHPSSFENKASFIIDLKTEYQITYIAYRLTTGTTTLTFHYGTPFHWENIEKRFHNNTKEWILFPVTVNTRYLQIVSSNAESGISEIALYGYQTGENPSNPGSPTTPITKTPVDQFVGMNAFIDDPLDVLRVSGIIREYHNFSWTLNEKDKNQFSPGSWWDFDKYYQMLHDADIEVVPCIQGNTSFLLGQNGLSTQYKPILKNADPTDPKSYSEHASGLFQYAARYGHTNVADEKLLLKENQTKRSGLGYITYYEDWNEPDKTWEKREGYFHPYELAAMTSADYDGHQSTLGSTYGIKNADSNAKLVLGGVAGGSSYPKYLSLMKMWFDANRTDGILPFDVINFHYYAGLENPEASDFVEITQNIVNWRNQNASGKEIWVTEFGWDTNPNSPIGVPSEDTQRDYLIRTYLLAMRLGLDRATMYMVRDTGNSSNTGKYGTSGLTTQKGDWKKKSSWYGVLTMRETLKDYLFTKVIKETNDVYIYQFNKPNTNEIQYVFWSPTKESREIKNYEFTIGEKENVTITKMEKGKEEGVTETLPVTDGKVSLPITGSPIFMKTTEPVNKTELIQFLEVCKQLNQNEYTKDSWESLYLLLSQGDSLIQSKLATQLEIDSMIKKMKVAYHSLVKKEKIEENVPDNVPDNVPTDPIQKPNSPNQRDDNKTIIGSLPKEEDKKEVEDVKKEELETPSEKIEEKETSAFSSAPIFMIGGSIIISGVIIVYFLFRKHS